MCSGNVDTPFVYDNKDQSLKKVLDDWYLQKLKFSTHDQIGFGFIIWKNDFISKLLTMSYNMKEKYIKSYRRNHVTA